MKVLHLCYFPLTEDHPDYGRLRMHPGRWVHHLALAQVRHTDISPELMVQIPGASCDFETTVEGIPIHFLRAPSRFRSATLFWFDSRRLASRVRALAPDLVHAHGTEDAYALAAQRSGLPYVITAQGFHRAINSICKPPLLSRERAVEWTESFCLGRAQHVIAKSDYISKELKSAFPQLILHRIANTYDPAILTLDETRVAKTVIFVGRISPRKGLHHLADALELGGNFLPPMTLWIVGNCVSNPSPYESMQLQRLQTILGPRLKLWGEIPHMEAVRLAARASLLVAPSVEEMFGNQVVEALLVGTPTIVNEGTALAENIREFGNGTIVPTSDPQAFLTAICSRLAIHENGDLSRSRIRKAFAPEEIARRHHSVYLSVLTA